MGAAIPNLFPLLSSLMSDHTPLLLQGELDHQRNSSFRFENFWTKMQGFQEMVQDTWNKAGQLDTAPETPSYQII